MSPMLWRDTSMCLQASLVLRILLLPQERFQPSINAHLPSPTPPRGQDCFMMAEDFLFVMQSFVAATAPSS